jgi:hypothetical protein
MKQLAAKLNRLGLIFRTIRRSDDISNDAIRLAFDPSPWYRENSDEMLRVSTATAARLSKYFDIPWRSQADCYVTDRETSIEIQGTHGAAYRNSVLIGVNPGFLSDFVKTVAHELAHLLSHSIGDYECKFKGEGFACFATWMMYPAATACGIPLHYHTFWMLESGMDLSLEGLWQRRDYTPEIYDLGWSFSAFCVEKYGLDRYKRLYSSEGWSLDRRFTSSLGDRVKTVERAWHAHVRSRVPATAREISRMNRWVGHECSRIGVLNQYRQS